LQLSATLRTAVPYTINVDWSLIEPFLPQKASDDHIRVLHISDLHLTENLVHPEQAKSHILWQKRHDPKMLMRLSQAIDGLNPAFELLAVTGDLTGDGSRESFDSASQYIQEGPIKGRNTKRSPLWGINAKRGSFVLWPGNHDRYSGNHGHHIGVRLPLQRLDGRFEEYFELPKKQPDYPYVVGFKSQRTNDAELTLLLFVFDSGLIDPRMEASLYRRIAYGQITDGEITKLNKLSQTVSEGNVDDLFGTAMHITPDNTIRIALLHHHPVTSFEIEKKEEEQRRHPFKSFFAEPRKVVASMSYELTNLQGAERFVKGCFEAGIQIILFGHDHTEFRRAVFAKKGVKSPFGITTHIRTFCCPSALQISKECKNGFYVFDFIDKNEFNVDYCAFTREGSQASISIEREKSDKLQFSTLTKEEREQALILRELV